MREVEKKMSKMTEKEILRQQLELLAEKSKSAADVDLPELTSSMVRVFEAIQCYL